MTDKRTSVSGEAKSSPNRSSIISTGRGGAGNIGSDAEKALPPTVDSLKTPTIKTEHFTTGRGGTGNMAYNHPSVPEMARASQDVTAPMVRRTDSDTSTTIMHGRGGAANITKADANGIVVGAGAGHSAEEGRGRDQSGRRLSQGWAEKGKGFLQRLRSKSRNGVAEEK